MCINKQLALQYYAYWSLHLIVNFLEYKRDTEIFVLCVVIHYYYIQSINLFSWSKKMFFFLFINVFYNITVNYTQLVLSDKCMNIK